jgi:hypothetical protein
MSLTMVLYYWDLFPDFIHHPVFLNQRFKGWFFPRPQMQATLLGTVD